MTELGKRVPVEPLEDERVARIERAIVGALPAGRPRASRWRWAAPWAIAAVAAAAALIAWRVVAAPAPSPVAPVTVAAAPDGTRVDLGDAVILTGAGASFTVTRPDGGVSIELSRGRIELEVAPRHGRAPLIVHAADVDVVVVGTHFTVDREPVAGTADDVAVAVTRGVVRVERGGELTTLAAGDEWSRRAAIAALAPRPDGEASGGATIDVLHDRTASVPPPPSDEPAPFEGTGSRPPPHGHVKPKEVHPAVEDPIGDFHHEIDAQAIVAPESAVPEEVKVYGDALALWRKGKDALRTLDLYVARFRDGAQLGAVLWLRIRILCKGGFDDRCRAAAHTYLTKVGASGKRGELAERVTHTR